MNLSRREFLYMMAIASAGGVALGNGKSLAAQANALYDLPPFGSVSLLHITDCHEIGRAHV